MRRVLITGLSGSGKSTAVRTLARRGVAATDLDHPEWSEWQRDASGQPDWVWREDRVRSLLEGAPTDNPFFISGCMTHQGRFYPLLEQVVLLSAPLDVLLHRLTTRSDNGYGTSADQQREVAEYVRTVEPLLRSGCDLELDTSHWNPEQVADALMQLAGH